MKSAYKLKEHCSESIHVDEHMEGWEGRKIASLQKAWIFFTPYYPHALLPSDISWIVSFYDNLKLVSHLSWVLWVIPPLTNLKNCCEKFQFKSGLSAAELINFTWCWQLKWQPSWKGESLLSGTWYYCQIGNSVYLFDVHQRTVLIAMGKIPHIWCLE